MLDAGGVACVAKTEGEPREKIELQFGSLEQQQTAVGGYGGTGKVHGHFLAEPVSKIESSLDRLFDSDSRCSWYLTLFFGLGERYRSVQVIENKLVIGFGTRRHSNCWSNFTFEAKFESLGRPEQPIRDGPLRAQRPSAMRK